MDSKYLILVTSMMVAGCSGGSDVSNTITQTDTPNTGVFLDSAVEGINYTTATVSGTTNAKGEFKYNDGETITFSIGDIDLPSSTAGSVITPLDLVGSTSLSDTSVVNITRLLQSLDTDGDPVNGISISEAAHLSATGVTVNFASPTFDNDVMNLVANSGSVTTSLIDESTAMSHLQSTLADSGLLTLTGSWYNTDGHKMIVTLLDESNYFVTMDIDEVAEPACLDGMESGTYTWNSVTESFSLTNVIDTTGSCGLTSTQGETYTTSASISGNTLTIVDALEGVADAYSKVVNSNNPLIGSWYLDESNIGENRTLVTFIDDTNYFVTQDVNETSLPPSFDGMEYGAYTWNSTTGDITFTNVIDTTGDSGFTSVQGEVWTGIKASVNNNQLTLTDSEGSIIIDAVK